jgi:NAD(P)-dependent dehydrogenase (short-subunit alcohol dehydrogenase family)
LYIKEKARMTKQLNVLVTGASSGIGRATALALGERGHRVFAAARRESELEELARANPGIESLPLDLTDGDSLGAAVSRVDELTAEQGLDVLVNSAGYALGGPVETLSSEAVQHQFQTNVFGLLDLTRALLPRMRERRSGRIINVSSVVGRVVFPGMGVYSASKFALEALSDALRMELAPFDVRVVLVEPGFVKTDIGAASQRQAEDFTVAASGYEELIRRSSEFVAKQVAENSIPAERVGAQIADAAEARNPKARYVLPVSGRILVGVMETLPVGAADRAKRRTLGLNRTAPQAGAKVTAQGTAA